MPRDYAKSQQKEYKPIAGWIWMSAGLIIGLFIALLIYIKDNSSGKIALTDTVSKVFKQRGETDTRTVKKNNTNTSPDQEQSINPVSTKPKFDFYTILPELEVAIPERELLNSSEDTSAENTSTKIIHQQFMLQAGSFKKFEEADKLKARLALEGFEANIQKVIINSTDTWHRVRIGPLNDIESLNQTRRRLRDLGIASIVVKDKN